MVTAALFAGDCRIIMAGEGPFDMVLADPPYGVTPLEWDRIVEGWCEVARRTLKPTGSMWVFGSMKSFLRLGMPVGFRMAQDVVWEKHNGSGFAADRFRRVHEHAVQFYRSDAPWAGVFNAVQKTPDAVKRAVRMSRPPATMRAIKGASFKSVDGGDRLMRTVLRIRSAHGRAIHRTEKPVELLDILIRTSCPKDGLVGDFFAGSGAGGEAAVKAGRNYVGAEINFAMAAKAQRRVMAATQGLDVVHRGPRLDQLTHAVRREAVDE